MEDTMTYKEIERSAPIDHYIVDETGSGYLTFGEIEYYDRELGAKVNWTTVFSNGVSSWDEYISYARMEAICNCLKVGHTQYYLSSKNKIDKLIKLKKLK